MGLFTQHPFSGNDADIGRPSPVDTASSVAQTVATLAANYRYGNADVVRRISPINYHNYAPQESPQGRIQLAPMFLPSKISQ